MTSPAQPTRRALFADRILIILFLLVLATPMAARLVLLRSDDELLGYEQGVGVPGWSWRPSRIIRYPMELQTYYDTHFAFRIALMRLHAWLKIDVFGVSTSDKVVLGNDGWLFYAGEGTLDDYRRIRPFSPSELEGWSTTLVTRRDWLRKRGIEFLFVIAPNPQTLYPEYMAESVHRADGPSRMEQLIAYLKQNTDIEVLDLRPALLAGKQHELVAYKTDPHWNQVGGFIAYKEISAWMHNRFPSWRTFSIEDFERHLFPNWHGGMAHFLGAPSMFGETRIELRPRGGNHVTTDGTPLPYDEIEDAKVSRPRVDRYSDDGEVPAAIFVRDSQFAAPGQFLTRHFRHSVLLWSRTLDPAVVDEIHPQVVVQSVAERLLMAKVPVDPPLP